MRVGAMFSLEAFLSAVILLSSLLISYSLVSKHIPASSDEIDNDVKFLSFMLSLDRSGCLDEIFRCGDYMKLYNALKSILNLNFGMTVIDGFSGAVLFKHPEGASFSRSLYYYFYSNYGFFIISISWC
ncbi:MAG: hypothetical protein NDF52_00565 [archaeon YNP-WB-062]|nr:hypothetical protein [Candidatus Culexarchaeum yellowstonense]